MTMTMTMTNYGDPITYVKILVDLVVSLAICSSFFVFAGYYGPNAILI
jgi:hypothetical protein